jgi:hypothetical protein
MIWCPIYQEVLKQHSMQMTLSYGVQKNMPPLPPTGCNKLPTSYQHVQMSGV